MLVNGILFDGGAAAFIGLLLVAALLTSGGNIIPNRLLAFGILCSLYRRMMVVSLISGNIENYPYLFRSSFPTELLAIVVFYFYVRALTTPGFRFEKRDAVHLTPFLVGLAWYLGALGFGPKSLFQLGPTYYQEQYVRVVIKMLVTLPYLFLVKQKIDAFTVRAKEHVSNLTPLRIRWLRVLMASIYSIALLDALDVLTGPSIPTWHALPALVLFNLLILAFFSMRYSAVFAEEMRLERQEESVESGNEDKERKDKGESPVARLSPEQLARQTARLLEVLEAKKLYLNPELRLSDLALVLGLKPYRVSEILNQGLGVSFYDLVNRERVKRAEALLTDPDSQHLNLLGVAMESGFGSKSVFNDVFKKVTGKTPSQFRAERCPAEARIS